MKSLNIFRYDSPAGLLEYAFCGEELVMLDWVVSKKHLKNIARVKDFITEPRPESRKKLITFLDNYFAGNFITNFMSLRMIGSDFEILVWERLCKIPFGSKITYGQLADSIGRPSAVRAVSGAVGRNPMSIIIPCHRVVAAGNNSGGYAGGLPAKKMLLELEGQTF